MKDQKHKNFKRNTFIKINCPAYRNVQNAGLQIVQQ